jgi:TRAP-type C4-dicarboxylate transport system permease small subunit
VAALYKTLRFVLFALIVALVVSVAMGVFWRYVLQRSLFWATEVPNFLFVWIVFLGAVVAYHEKKHIAFTALLDVVPPRTRAAVEIMGLLLVLATCAFLLVTGWMVVRQTMGSPSEALKIPQGYVYSVLPIASLLIGIDTLAMLQGRLRVLRGREAAK